MHVSWVTAFVDRPYESFAAAEAFWCAAHSATVSSRRGVHGEFATLMPPDGDPYVRVQCTRDGSVGSHVDLHVADVRAGADEALTFGATIVDDGPGLVVLRSPGGLPFCIVHHHGESTRPVPVVTGDTTRTQIDQICIDAAPERFEAERTFWTAVTGWRILGARRPEFTALVRPDGMPIRLLLQRRGPDAEGEPTSCHLDLACDDVTVAEAAHAELGATMVERHRYWTVMADPAGVPYCLTRRSTATGMLPPERD